MPENAPVLDPRRTALLVMDYQNGVVGMLDAAADAMARAAEAVDVARERGVTVGYVRVGFTDADYDALPDTSPFAAMLTPQRRTAMHADSPHTAVHDRVRPADEDIVVRKCRVGAFSTTDLDERLRAAGITTLILAGIATSGVVLSTVRDAADRDYRLVVLADACADRTTEVHDFLIEQIFPHQARIAGTADLPGLLATP